MMIPVCFKDHLFRKFLPVKSNLIQIRNMTCHIRALCAVSSEDLPLRTSVHLIHCIFCAAGNSFSFLHRKGTLSIFFKLPEFPLYPCTILFSTAGSSVIGDSMFSSIWLRALQILAHPLSRRKVCLVLLCYSIHPVGRSPILTTRTAASSFFAPEPIPGPKDISFHFHIDLTVLFLFLF